MEKEHFDRITKALVKWNPQVLPSLALLPLIPLTSSNPGKSKPQLLGFNNSNAWTFQVIIAEFFWLGAEFREQADRALLS